MTAFFRGPSLFTHVFLLATLEGVSGPLIWGYAHSVFILVLWFIGLALFYSAIALLCASIAKGQEKI